MLGEKLMTYPSKWIKKNEQNLSNPEEQWCSKEESNYLSSMLGFFSHFHYKYSISFTQSYQKLKNLKTLSYL